MTGYVADLSWKSGARDWKVRSTKVDYGSECVKNEWSCTEVPQYASTTCEGFYSI